MKKCEKNILQLQFVGSSKSIWVIIAKMTKICFQDLFSTLDHVHEDGTGFSMIGSEGPSISRGGIQESPNDVPWSAGWYTHLLGGLEHEWIMPPISQFLGMVINPCS